MQSAMSSTSPGPGVTTTIVVDVYVAVGITGEFVGLCRTGVPVCVLVAVFTGVYVLVIVNVDVLTGVNVGVAVRVDVWLAVQVRVIVGEIVGEP